MNSLIEIRRLGSADEAALLAWLHHDRENNIYQLAHLADKGPAHLRVRYHGLFRGERLVGAFMVRGKCLSVAWDVPEAIPYLAEMISDGDGTFLTNSRRTLQPILGLLPAGRCKEVLAITLARLRKDQLRPWPSKGERLATEADVDLLVSLYAHHRLFTRPGRDRMRSLILGVIRSGGMITCITRGDVAVSAARVSASGQGLGMIGGVITRPEYRGQGLARACTGMLSSRLHDAQIEPFLTYDPKNQAAAKAYSSLGFEDVSPWFLVSLARRETRHWHPSVELIEHSPATEPTTI